MKRAKTSLRELLGDITPEERAEAQLSLQISNRLDFPMQEKGRSKKQLADAIGKLVSFQIFEDLNSLMMRKIANFVLVYGEVQSIRLSY